MKDQLQLEDVKKLAYGVLENFKSVCERNDIYYILSFGTALGAVRHNGFIPWDDDIDVCVFRKDYQKLIEAYAKEIITLLECGLTCLHLIMCQTISEKEKNILRSLKGIRRFGLL